MRPRAALNPELPLVARRTFDGYKPGDVFNASRVNIRRLGQLYRSGYITHADAVTADAVTADAVTADAVTADAVTADAVTADAVTADAVTADAVTADAVTADAVTADAVTADAVTADAVTADDSGIECVNTGAGWYNVELGGVALNTAKLKGLEAAKLWAKEQGYVS